MAAPRLGGPLSAGTPVSRAATPAPRRRCSPTGLERAGQPALATLVASAGGPADRGHRLLARGGRRTTRPAHRRLPR